MPDVSLARWAEVFLVGWTVVVFVHALWAMRDLTTEPAAPVEPDPHH